MVRERLGQERDCARSQGSPTGFLAVVSCNENNRNAAARCSQLTLQLQSVHAGQPHINHEARRIVEMARAEKILSRFENCCSKPKRLDEQFCGPANRLIVVNDRDQILCPSDLSTELT